MEGPSLSLEAKNIDPTQKLIALFSSFFVLFGKDGGVNSIKTHIYVERERRLTSIESVFSKALQR